MLRKGLSVEVRRICKTLRIFYKHMNMSEYREEIAHTTVIHLLTV